MVVTLKAYLDDSRNDTWVTVGGCLGHLDAWERFEGVWPPHLAEFQVPWLHMKDFNNPNPDAQPYGHLKGERAARGIEFMSASRTIITDHAHLFPACSVRLDDLEAFNAKHKLKLDPYSLAIYGCLILMRKLHSDPIQLIIDRFDKAPSRTDTALEYAATDLGRLKADEFIQTHLRGAESFRNVLPLQAADFVAYETCKYRAERKALRLSAETRDDPELMYLAITQFEKRQKPRDRKSFQTLREDAAFRVRHFTWETYDFEYIMRHRQPSGWGA